MFSQEMEIKYVQKIAIKCIKMAERPFLWITIIIVVGVIVIKIIKLTGCSKTKY